jgi:hypothetical protein
MSRRLTTEEFIERARKIHGDLYDYSKTEYVRSGDRVEISCRVPSHDPFLMTPDNHTHRTRPQGCPKCGREKAAKARNKTTEEFLIEAREVHGNRYDLSSVDYKKAKVKVNIGCKKHGVFAITPDHFLKGQGCKKCGVEKRSKARATPEPDKSLLDLHPKLSEEWSDFNSISPSECRPGSSRNAFWQCRKCAHEWWAPINARVNGRGCGACNRGYLHSAGLNSMFHTHPELAAELMPNQYGTAKSLVAGINELLPWRCSVCEHEWMAAGSNRKQGGGCSHCKKGTLHSDGRNSMAITHPQLAKELMPNEYGTADTLVAGSAYLLPWKCITCEHEWPAVSYSRRDGNGCPACANQALHSDGRNSMARTHPRLAEELMPNQYGTAETLIAGTNKRLHWKCYICEHEWKTTGNNRVMGSGTDCPACVNQVLHMNGLNSIAAKLPEIANELMPNPFGTAETIVYVSTEKLPWKCSACGHEWMAKGRDRARGSGCSPCNRGGLRSDGSNSMVNTHLLLAKELLPNEHGTPDTLIAGTNKILPWKCSSCEFEWETTGAHRIYDETGCPKCAIHGFQPHLPAQYYVHEIRNIMGDIIYYKGGISGDWMDRLRHLKSHLPDHLKYNNIEVIFFNLGKNARIFEKKLLAIEEIRAPQREFDGGTELFIENPLKYAHEIGLV